MSPLADSETTEEVASSITITATPLSSLGVARSSLGKKPDALFAEVVARQIPGLGSPPSSTIGRSKSGRPLKQSAAGGKKVDPSYEITENDLITLAKTYRLEYTPPSKGGILEKQRKALDGGEEDDKEGRICLPLQERSVYPRDPVLRQASSKTNGVTDMRIIGTRYCVRLSFPGKSKGTLVLLGANSPLSLDVPMESRE